MRFLHQGDELDTRVDTVFVVVFLVLVFNVGAATMISVAVTFDFAGGFLFRVADSGGTNEDFEAAPPLSLSDLFSVLYSPEVIGFVGAFSG